jgi:hypothetical protein
MKKKVIMILMIGILMGVFGCALNPVTVELTGKTTIAVGEAVLLTPSSSKTSAEYQWTTSDENVVSVDEGIIEGISEGTATITVTVKGTKASKDLLINVVSSDYETIQTINALAETLLGSIPGNIESDLVFEESDPASGSAIAYSSDLPTALENDGTVHRGTEDVEVHLTLAITLNEVTRSFSKTITIMKMSAISVIGDSEIEIGTERQFSASSPDGTEFVFSSSNLTVLEISETGLATAKKAGTSIITIALANDLNSFVNYTVTVFDPLEFIGVYLKTAIPDEISEDVEFLTTNPFFEMNVIYQTNSDFITNEGIVTRDQTDRFVTISLTVTYQDRTKIFSKSVKILMIPAETQAANTNQWIQENVGGLVSAESGALPVTEGVYDRSLVWLGSEPGMIMDGQLFPSLNSSAVKLVARYVIANQKYQYVFGYASEGVSEMNKNEYINNFFSHLFPTSASNRINVPYEEEVVVTQSIVYPNTVNQMRPGAGLVGQKMNGGVKYIVIHDTGMSGAADTAVGVDSYIHAQANSLSGRVASWHYSIDDTDCFQHVPNDEIAWHAGDGSHAYGTTYYNNDYKAWCIGGGNQNGIGIETCINFGGNYQKTLRRTAKLVATLLNEYGLGLDAIKQHNDFSGKGCPAVIRSSVGRWEEFLKMVEFQLFLLQLDGPISYKLAIDDPEAINYDGIVNQDMINDAIVNLNLAVNVNGVSSSYDYAITASGMSTSEKFSSLYLYMYNNVIPRETSESLILPSENLAYGATLTWSSNRPEILSDSGVYNQPAKKTLVSLSVTITIGDETLQKVFKIYVI